MKHCKKCDTSKPVSEFYKGTHNGTQFYCKECDRARVRNRTVEYDNRRGGHGLKAKDARRMRETFACAICGEWHPKTGPGTGMAVDHDHDTKEIRGVLCYRCNRGLGLFRDDHQLLRKAIEYLG